MEINYLIGAAFPLGFSIEISMGLNRLWALQTQLKAAESSSTRKVLSIKLLKGASMQKTKVRSFGYGADITDNLMHEVI